MFQLNWSDPAVRWLVVTNWTLFAVTLISIGVVVYGIAIELTKRSRRRSAAEAFADDHVVMVTDLGLTMADGGESTDKKRKRQK